MSDILREYISNSNYYFESIAVGVLFTTGIGVYTVKKRLQIRRREFILRERQEKRAEEFKDLEEKYPLTESRIAIIELPFDDLIDKLQKRELSALEVLEAFTAKTVAVTKKFNCVTEFIPYAFTMAKEMDDAKDIKGPLHGLPICIKDDTDVVGMDTTVGCVKNLGKPKSKNAPIVETLIDLGAIPFCKTNVPQTLLAVGSHNPIYGETVNPLNPKLSPGGSSSGTGCLVGAGGVLVGTGSDTGGSVRIPAHFNGISTIRPTYRRHSSRGVAEALFPGLPGIKGVPGILAKSSQIVTTVFRHVTEGNPQYKFDHNVALVRWDNKLFESREKLKIGYYTSFDYFPAMGDTEEVVLSAKSALEKNGHELIPFEHPHTCKDWLKTLSDLIYSDTGFHFKELMAGENVSHSIQDIYNFQCTPLWVRRLLAFFLGFLPGKGPAHNKELLLGGIDSHSSDRLWAALEQRRRLIDELQQRMDFLKLDLILGPVFPFAAPKVGDAGKLIYATGYTMYYNVVDFPAGVIPFGTESGKHISTHDCQNHPLWKTAKASLQDSTGMPIGVQIVGKPFQEEVVLRMMVELEELRPKDEKNKKDDKNKNDRKDETNKKNEESKNDKKDEESKKGEDSKNGREDERNKKYKKEKNNSDPQTNGDGNRSDEDHD